MPELNAQEIGPYRVGVVPLPVVVTFRDKDQDAVDLSGYQAKWIIRQHADGGYGDFQTSDPAPVTRDATVLDQGTSKGQVQYAWAAAGADFTTAGFYEAEMWVGNGLNRFASIRFLWRTYPALAVPSI